MRFDPGEETAAVQAMGGAVFMNDMPESRIFRDAEPKVRMG